MKKIKILFYIEHLDRELDTVNKIISGLNLSPSDYAIASTNFSMGLSKFMYSPEVVVSPWCYTDFCYHKLLSFPFKKQIKFLNLHHEQITNNDRLKALLPRGKAIKHSHISWGSWFERQLIESGVKTSDIYVTGSIRVSGNEVSPLNKKNVARDIFGDERLARYRWAMFLSSFSWKDLPERILRNIEKRGRKNVQEYKELVSESYQTFLRWLDNFLIKNPNTVYIYKLHPSENIDQGLEKLQSKNSNFFVVDSFSVKSWGAVVDWFDVWISTSIGEVADLGIPFRIVRPLTLPKSSDIIGFDIFEKISSVSEFVTLDNIHKNQAIVNEYQKMYYESRANPVDLTLKAFSDILSSRPERIEISFLKRVFYSFLESAKDILKILLVKFNLLNFSNYSRIGKSFFIIKK